MRIAWFRSTATTNDDPVSATGAIVRTLAARATLDVVTADTAHAFVPTHALTPYDLCVYEPRNTRESAFVFAYLFNYPGVLILQDRTLHDVRTLVLERRRLAGAYASEFAFNQGHPSRACGRDFARGHWPMLRAPMLASRLTVVFDEEQKRALEVTCPDADIRLVPRGVEGPAADPSTLATGPLIVASARPTDGPLLAEAVERAQQQGARLALAPHVADLADGCDAVVLALEPLDEEPSLVDAMAAMARGQVVLVHERDTTAAWPALDAHVWRPRGIASESEPIAVSLDPRDEAHSLTIALVRLANEPATRQRVGRAARTWWRHHGSTRRAADAWWTVLEEATRKDPVAVGQGWPAHLNPDGFEPLHTIGADLGVALDPP